MTLQPQQIDMLYQEYDHNLYKITGSENSDSILDMLQADPTANNSSNVQVSSSDLGSGVSTATTQTASGSSQQGKKLFTDTVQGYILGVDPKDGFAKFAIGNATSFLQWDGTTLTTTGTINASGFTTMDSGGNTVMSANASGQSSVYALVITPTSNVPAGVLVATSQAGVGFNYVNTTNVNNRGLFIQQTSTGGNNINPAAEIDYGGSAQGLDIEISGTGNGIAINRSAGTGVVALLKILDTVASSGQLILAQKTNNTGSGILVQFENVGNGASQVLNLVSAGTGTVLTVSKNNAGGNALVDLEDTSSSTMVTMNKTGSGLVFDINQTATSASALKGIGISISNSGAGGSYAFQFAGMEHANAAVGGSQDQKIRILIGATVYYIPCYTA